MDVNELKKRYDAVSKEIQRRELQNEMIQKDIQKAREEIKALGFDPDNVHAEIEKLQAEVDAKLKQLDAELTTLEQELSV